MLIIAQGLVLYHSPRAKRLSLEFKITTILKWDTNLALANRTMYEFIPPPIRVSGYIFIGPKGQGIILN